MESSWLYLADGAKRQVSRTSAYAKGADASGKDGSTAGLVGFLRDRGL